jgi:ATP-dependent protease ClpP protease subunit
MQTARRLTIHVNEPDNLEPDTPSGGPMLMGRNDIKGHIYFYEQITQASAFRLISQLHALDEEYRTAKANFAGTFEPVICLHLNSFGGEAFASLAIADRIQTLSTPVECIVEGMAASGGSIIACACDSTFMLPSSVMLIHQQSSWFVGTHEQWKDESKLQSILIEQLVSFYKSHSNLEEAEIRNMLKHDYWMDAKEAYSKGFIDGIYNPKRRNRD